jgi:lipid-A-disaccharide synthase-like uncharacterized protein
MMEKGKIPITLLGYIKPRAHHFTVQNVMARSDAALVILLILYYFLFFLDTITFLGQGLPILHRISYSELWWISLDGKSNHSKACTITG